MTMHDLSVVNSVSVAEAAAHYAAAGYRVVIVHGVSFPPDLDGAPCCSCQRGGACGRDSGKHPRFDGWPTDPSTRDPARAYRRYPESNVGLAMGATPDGGYHLALDVDGGEGAASVAILIGELGALPATFTNVTPRGRHLVFCLPPGIDPSALRNAAGGLRSPAGVALPGLDVRTEGGQIVVAPSMHASGERYQWSDGREPAVLPEAWARWLASPPAPPTPPPPQSVRIPRHPATRPARYARAILDAACRALIEAPRGTRNNEATSQAFGVGGLLWVGAFSEDEALQVLLAATRSGGWDASAEAKTLDTLARSLRDGAKPVNQREIPAERESLHTAAPASSVTEQEAPVPTSAGPTPASLPVIQIREHELQRMVLEGIGALAGHDRNLYQRAGELVTVVREPDRVEPLCGVRASLAEPCEACGAPVAEGCARDRRAGGDVVLRPGTPRLRPISPPVLLERLSVAAQWEKYNGKSKEWHPSAPPSRVASIILAPDREKQGVRPIQGLLEAPSLRPDGTVIEVPGYDIATGYVLIPSASFPPVPANPTRQEAAEALRRIWIHCFADFPYRGLGEAPADWRISDPLRHAQYEVARTIPDAFVGLMALLTIVARPAIDGAVPAAVFEAAAQGSGKSKQMHIVAVATTGRPAGVMTFPARGGDVNEEELEKVLGSYAVAGARIVAFDNVKARLGGPALEGKLTAEGVAEFRILGQTTLVTLPWSAIVLFSGNNITMNDDVAQRSLLSRLESPREDPRSRPAESFLYADLLGHVREARPEIIRDALTVLRALYAAPESERPPPRVLGSFEAWSSVVPRAIAYAGGPDILAARPSQSAGATTDSEGDAHIALMRGWPFNAAAKAKDVLAELFDAEQEALRNRSQPPVDGRDEARDAVRSLCRTRDGTRPSAKSFGKVLSEIRGKIRDGMRIDGVTDRTKVLWWSVVGRQDPVNAPPEV